MKLRASYDSPVARPSPFDRTPFIVFWETTRACALACRHCRAEAIPNRDPKELTTDEGKRLLDEIKAMGCPIVVLTGGDPAERPDLVELVRHGTSIDLRVALTPSATPKVTDALLQELSDAGLARLAISLDGIDAASHDGFRGVEGSFERTFEILGAARRLGLTTQVNTTVTDLNVGDLEKIAERLVALDISLWSVFFLVPTGRATQLDVLDPERVEQVLERLADIAEAAPFDVKTTAAPHYRRVLLTRKVKRQDVVGIDDGIGRAPRGVNDGQGVLFVSHVGDVYPSGFLPLERGNIRERALAEIYRDDELFRSLRDADLLGGKCGLCEFRKVCGGSRARAYAMTGDPMAEEPACAHLPPSLREER